jgi:hypothetical protein
MVARCLGEDKPVLEVSGVTLENTGSYYCLVSTHAVKASNCFKGLSHEIEMG